MNAVLLEVRDYMTADVITVSPTDEITRAVQLMIERDVSGLVVVDNGDRVVGVITERDGIAVAASAGYFEEWGGPVQQYMSAPVECVAPGENLVDVAARMIESRYRRFPVVEQGRLVGVLTRRDVLRALKNGSWFKR
jgi:CBS domain-containing protein